MAPKNETEAQRQARLENAIAKGEPMILDTARGEIVKPRESEQYEQGRADAAAGKPLPREHSGYSAKPKPEPVTFYRVTLHSEGGNTEYRSMPRPEGCLFAIQRRPLAGWQIGTRVYGEFVSMDENGWAPTLKEAKEAVRTMARHPQRVELCEAVVTLRNVRAVGIAGDWTSRLSSLVSLWRRGEDCYLDMADDGYPIMQRGTPSGLSWEDLDARREDATVAGLRRLAEVMHGEAVDLWNIAHKAHTGRDISRGEPFPHREEIEAMQRVLSAIAWPS